MSVWSVLRTRGWALAALGVVVGMVACALLGLWQYSRYETKSAIKATVLSHYNARPVPLATALPTRTAALRAGEEWTAASIRGRYCTDPGCVLYVRNRTVNGDTGFLQLVPFTAPEGTILVVRGFVRAQSTASAPASPPPIPTGEVSVVVRLRPAEPMLRGRSDPPGQVQTIDPADISTRLPRPLPLFTHVYGQMASESPAAAPAPLPLEKPDVDLGPHLSYAFQWWAFGAFLPIAWVVRARQAVAEARADGADRTEASSGGVPQRSGEKGREDGRRTVAHGQMRRRRRSRDEEEEDDYVDSRVR